jgi:hypothetical protein
MGGMEGSDSRVGDAREGGSGVAKAQEVVEAQDAAHGDGHEGGVEELQGCVDVADQPAHARQGRYSACAL